MLVKTWRPLVFQVQLLQASGRCARQQQRRPLQRGTHKPFFGVLCHTAAHPGEPFTGPPAHICTCRCVPVPKRSCWSCAQRRTSLRRALPKTSEMQKGKRREACVTWSACWRSCDDMPASCGKARLRAKPPHLRPALISAGSPPPSKPTFSFLPRHPSTASHILRIGPAPPNGRSVKWRPARGPSPGLHRL